MSVSDSATELLSELKALVVSGGPIGEIDEPKIRSILEDIDASFQHMSAITSNPYADPTQPFYGGSMAFFRAKYLRDKRCLLAYLLWRQKKITDSWWDATDNLLVDFLSSAEKEFLSDFNDVMVEYMTSFAIPVDLRAYIWRPPSLQQIEVRGVKECSFVSSVSNSIINIYPGKQISLSIEEAEPLIQQKAVELGKETSSARMQIRAVDISPKAAAKEEEMQGYFFKLFARYSLRNKGVVGSVMTMDCLDEINYRYADFLFLYIFFGAYALRKRKGSTRLDRLWFPLYCGLVGYDVGLRSSSPCPAMTFWNSAVVLDSSLGAASRRVHTPSTFYLPKSQEKATPSYANYISWLKGELEFLLQSLVLSRVFCHTFDGSCLHQQLGTGAQRSSLVINSRFFKWNILTKQVLTDKNGVSYSQIAINLFPRVEIAPYLLRSYECRESILQQTSFAASMWYGFHFAVISFLGGKRNSTGLSRS